MLHAQCAAFRGSRAYTDADAAARQAGQNFNGLPEGLTRLGYAGMVKRNRSWLGISPTLMDHLVFLILRTCDHRTGNPKNGPSCGCLWRPRQTKWKSPCVRWSAGNAP